MKRQFSALSVFVLALGALAEEAEGIWNRRQQSKRNHL
jgi:hypothetical protein